MIEAIHPVGLSDDDDRTLNLLLEQLDARFRRNLLRASFYDGKHACRQIGTVIAPQYYRLGIVLGWSAKAVDILARRCNLDGFVWPEGDLLSLGLREVTDDNQLHSEISGALVSSLIHSTAFLINTRGEPLDGEPESLIHVKDALNATGEWNARRRQLDNLLSITSRDDDGKPTSLALYLDGLTITAEKDQGRWSVVDESEHPWGVPAEPLAYKPRPGRPFGSSRISRPVMSIHERAMRAAIRMEGHMDVFSMPQMILLGAKSDVFKNADGSMKAAWQVALGRVFAVPDDEEREGDSNARADVKQFQASAPTPHIQQLEALAKEFSGEASIPLDSLGYSDRANPTSADSYIASREDLISEAEGATDDWSRPLTRCVRRALAIANGEKEIPAEWSTIEPKWRSPVHLSRAQAADAGLKQLQAIPWLAETEVGLELIGLDEQQIRRASADRRRAEARAVLNRLTPPSGTDGDVA